MCGLVGFTGKGDFDQHTMELLFVWNSLERGEDATGLYSPVNGLKKSLTRGSDFVIYTLDEEEYFVKDKIFIGHVRSATIGSKDLVDNAHPFKRGNYVLAHNGTLKNHRDLLQKHNLTDDTTFNVDSDCVAGALNASNDIFETLADIEGAGAFIITDIRNPNRLYVFRNKERPLWRGYDENGGMYLSSLAEPLYFAGLDKVKEFKEDILYSIRDGVISTSRSETRKIVNKPYHKPVPVVTNTYTSPNYNHLRYGDIFEDETRMPDTKEDSVGLFKDVWLRANKSINYYDEYFGFRVNLVKDEWYLINSDSNNSRKFWVQFGDSDFVEVEKTYFKMIDLITCGDYVKLLENEVWNSSYTTYVGDKDDILAVRQIYKNGEILVAKPTDSTFGFSSVISSIAKTFVRKLTAEEKERFMKEKNEAILKIVENNSTNTAAVEAVTSNSEAPFVTKEEHEESLEIIVNEKLVINMFKDLDTKLVRLKEDMELDPLNIDTFEKQVNNLLVFVRNQKSKVLYNVLNV